MMRGRSWGSHGVTVRLLSYNHCHKSLAHTHSLSPMQCWKAQFVQTRCELALFWFVDNIEWVGREGDSNRCLCANNIGMIVGQFHMCSNPLFVLGNKKN